MADELNTNVEPTFVSPDTDDLDAFNDLIHGRAKEAPEKEEVEEKDDKSTPQEVDSEEDDNEPDNEVDDSETPDGEEDKGESPDDQDEPKSEEEPPKKKTSRYQERIDELTAKAREAERREKEVLRRLDELAAKQTDNTEKQPVSKKEDIGPTPDDQNEDGSDKYPLGEFDPSYIRDLTRHTIQAETAAANERYEQERAQREATQAREELQNQWVQKVTAASTAHEDFMEKTVVLEDTFEGLDPGYSDYLVQTIKSLDHGPDVLYHFANNLDEAKEFVKLGPLAATLALGEMNARFKQPKTQEAKPQPKVSNAPPPPQVQNKGTKTRTTTAADTDDLDAFSQMLFAPKKRR